LNVAGRSRAHAAPAPSEMIAAAAAIDRDIRPIPLTKNPLAPFLGTEFIPTLDEARSTWT